MLYPAFKKTNAFVLLYAIFTFNSYAQYTLNGKVVRILDGDTISILTTDKTNHRIRLASIDAPEKHQAFGQKSKQHLASLVFKKQIIARCLKKDRYKRNICKLVSKETNLDINYLMVKNGLAWRYLKYIKHDSIYNQTKYYLAEKNAKQEKLGLWADISPIPPWEWRE